MTTDLESGLSTLNRIAYAVVLRYCEHVDDAHMVLSIGPRK